MKKSCIKIQLIVVPEQLIMIVLHLIAQLIVVPFHDFSYRQIICSNQIQYHSVT
jgi:hypothetical protein